MDRHNQETRSSCERLCECFSQGFFAYLVLREPALLNALFTPGANAWRSFAMAPGRLKSRTAFSAWSNSSHFFAFELLSLCLQRTDDGSRPPAAAGRSSASYKRGTGEFQAEIRPGSCLIWREGLGSEHALHDEVREAAAHLRQLIFNRKDGHGLAGDRCGIQPAEHLEQLVDFLKNVLERQLPVGSGHARQYSRNRPLFQLLTVVGRADK
jgi:hypothetical protein